MHEPRRFDLRAQRHHDVRIERVGIDQRHARILGRSLATFQVGESGTGEHLFAAARAAGVEQGYFDQLQAFVAEEQEHARLLALALGALGFPLRNGHWSDHAFVLIRHVRSLRTEVLTLLVAEVIALRYYSALRDGINDPTLQDVFARIHADELRHVEFHSATLPAHLRRSPRAVQRLARLLWSMLVASAAVMVSFDHGRALHIVGLRRLQFVRDVWTSRGEVSKKLFDDAI